MYFIGVHNKSFFPLNGHDWNSRQCSNWPKNNSRIVNNFSTLITYFILLYVFISKLKMVLHRFLIKIFLSYFPFENVRLTAYLFAKKMLVECSMAFKPVRFSGNMSRPPILSVRKFHYFPFIRSRGEITRLPVARPLCFIEEGDTNLVLCNNLILW